MHPVKLLATLLSLVAVTAAMPFLTISLRDADGEAPEILLPPSFNDAQSEDLRLLSMDIARSVRQRSETALTAFNHLTMNNHFSPEVNEFAVCLAIIRK